VNHQLEVALKNDWFDKGKNTISPSQIVCVTETTWKAGITAGVMVDSSPTPKPPFQADMLESGACCYRSADH
jgi:hypothetical protein